MTTTEKNKLKRPLLIGAAIALILLYFIKSEKGKKNLVREGASVTVMRRIVAVVVVVMLLAIAWATSWNPLGWVCFALSAYILWDNFLRAGNEMEDLSDVMIMPPPSEVNPATEITRETLTNNIIKQA